jgi:hypothetical protein
MRDSEASQLTASHHAAAEKHAHDLALFAAALFFLAFLFFAFISSLAEEMG